MTTLATLRATDCFGTARTGRADRIVAEVCDFYDIDLSDFLSPSRVNHLNHARQVAMYLLRKWTELSFEQIAFQVGRADHSTVIHGVQRIEHRLAVDEELAKQLALLESYLKGV